MQHPLKLRSHPLRHLLKLIMLLISLTCYQWMEQQRKSQSHLQMMIMPGMASSVSSCDYSTDELFYLHGHLFVPFSLSWILVQYLWISMSLFFTVAHGIFKTVQLHNQYLAQRKKILPNQQKARSSQHPE